MANVAWFLSAKRGPNVVRGGIVLSFFEKCEKTEPFRYPLLRPFRFRVGIVYSRVLQSYDYVTTIDYDRLISCRPDDS